ncbi:glutamate-rich protein 6 [Tachysurus fulvidraco]|uniref:glutamate-rich protein 6 n=1 Tax=Tachysurus fulvidraco TaxID=1234273 RepID=UPI001FEE9CEB|nr:glutamate-rich protein 6 [Tachysurus fulvidraco]XP_027012629.2 glutamate-rich protein 6 [Tachysurus fulvidraco]
MERKEASPEPQSGASPEPQSGASPEPQSEAKPEPGFHGVLRYRRESDWRKIKLLSQSPKGYTVWCEICGANAKPLIDFTKTPNPEDFCCPQYKELFKKVEQQWRKQHSGESLNDYDSGDEKTQHRARHQDIFQQGADEYSRKGKRQSSANQSEIPGCKVTSSGLFTTITFRLSDFVRMKERERWSSMEDFPDEKTPRELKLCSVPSSLPPGFGLRYHQGHIRKFYSNGNKCLIAHPDGTGQVFYPSGNLAIIAFIDDAVGVCIVLDDIGSSCPIRAFFQTSGIATCYHSNGSTCLHMDMWGGWSINEDMSRRSQWKWTDNTSNPTPFKPIQLSLNKNIGVRVRGQDSVMVTFLASGQKACLSVGSCTKPIEPPTPSLQKEELMLQVTQLNAQLALERLRWSLAVHSDAKRRCLRLPPGLVSQGRKLLRLSSSILTEDKDKVYIQHCLQDCQ